MTANGLASQHLIQMADLFMSRAEELLQQETMERMNEEEIFQLGVEMGELRAWEKNHGAESA